MDYVGGCQCGATRYRADGPRDRASVCYCRMCQKASGGPFMAFVRFPARQLTWSRPPAIFVSSTIAERGFCPDCGTPLTYRRIESEFVSVTLNSLDDPGVVKPEMCFTPEMQSPWCLTLAELPEAPASVHDSRFVNHQRKDDA